MLSAPKGSAPKGSTALSHVDESLDIFSVQCSVGSCLIPTVGLVQNLFKWKSSRPTLGSGEEGQQKLFHPLGVRTLGGSCSCSALPGAAACAKYLRTRTSIYIYLVGLRERSESYRFVRFGRDWEAGRRLCRFPRPVQSFLF